MDALRQPNLDLSNSSPLSSIYTKTPQTPTSSTFPYKYRLSSSSFNGYHSKCKVPTPPQALPKENSNESVESNKKLIDSIAKGLIRLAAAVSVNVVQRTLVETWGLIRETFADPTFNHQDWDSKLQQTMVEMHPLRTADAAYSKIKGMLSTLEDRFTRIISSKEYQSFRIGSDGNVQGVGLFVNTEPETGHLVLLSCVEGSPAARAGIHVGDELIEINGERVKGISGEAAAQRLRGYVGTSVTVKVHNKFVHVHISDLHGKKLAIDSSFREVKLPREFIRLSPILSVIIPHRTPNGHVSKTGYVKLLAFSQGGLVKAGLDVAQICLDGDETLVNTIDRDGNIAAMAVRQRPHQKKYKLRTGCVNVSHFHKPGNRVHTKATAQETCDSWRKRGNEVYKSGDLSEAELGKHKEVVQLEGNFSGEDTIRITTMNKHGKHDLDIPVIVNPRNDPPFINIIEFIMLENATEDDIHFPGHIHFPVYNTALFIYALTRFVVSPLIPSH
ncbi:unnamed protein product [Lactuca saligna]|uniref:C-terminal processing peptidase n=1 Tax=Lactuca saligna TaxID=75948 RepID=A0AA35ZFK4_LACSI|nr:unnamed protein product [Lactuca saligna]